MLVLDTNTLIYFFKGKGNVATRLLAMPPAEVTIPVIVIYELEVGIAKSTQQAKRRRQLDTLLDTVSVLSFDRAAAKAAAYIRSTLEKQGNAIGPLDTLIAGTAMAYKATLVTHNIGEFARVPGLLLTDWYD